MRFYFETGLGERFWLFFWRLNNAKWRCGAWFWWRPGGLIFGLFSKHCLRPKSETLLFLWNQKERNDKMREDGILYGELVVLGTDGELPNGNRGRRRSRFQVGLFRFKVFLWYFMVFYVKSSWIWNWGVNNVRKLQ